MPTNWIQEKCDPLTHAEQAAEKPLRGHPKSLVHMPTPPIDPPIDQPGRDGIASTAGYTQWKTCFIGLEVMIAALAGGLSFFFLRATGKNENKRYASCITYS